MIDALIGDAMSRFNLRDNLSARGRQLYLQTGNLDEYKIISTLFDGGRILAKEELPFASDLSPHKLDIGPGQVDLVDYRDDLQIVLQGQIQI